MLGPTRTARGRPLSRRQRAKQGFLASIEKPVNRDVREHTLQVACFRGWVRPRDGSAVRVRIQTGRDHWREVALDHPRPDVDDALADTSGFASASGFVHYIDLSPLDRPLPVRLEFSDGRLVCRSHRFLVDPVPDLMMLDTYVGDPPIMRDLSRKYLVGRGLEFGALHLPLWIDQGRCEMQYADQYTRDELLELFFDIRDELGDQMVNVDFKVDLNNDNLDELRPHEFDFFIANGVIEHLANPVRFLVNLHSAMKPGARFFVSAPDRDFTFDSRRALTTNEHLWDEYERDVRIPDDDHVADALTGLGVELPEEPGSRSALFDFHRDRSFHVHVWDEKSFSEFVRFVCDRASVDFEIVASAGPREADGNLVYVLERR